MTGTPFARVVVVDSSPLLALRVDPRLTGPAVVVGIDPGYNHTGLVIRRGMDLLGTPTVIHRAHDEALVGGDKAVKVGPGYAQSIGVWIRAFIDEAFSYADLTASPVLAAVEDMVAPTGRPVGAKPGQTRGVTPWVLLGAGKALGYAEAAVLATTARLVRVRPAKHGRNLLATYPEQLVSPAERRHGLNRPGEHSAVENHARSAWDIAGHAPVAARITEALDIHRATHGAPRKRTTRKDV